MKINADAAFNHLVALGYERGDKVYIRCLKEGAAGVKLNALKPFEVNEYQQQGYDVYFVVNGGGHKDADVKQCRAIFYEHDNLDKTVQLALWQNLGLPEPTIQVDTGGKSIHSYWVIDGGCSPEEWRSLQTDLLEFADADRSLKNPSRVMRLAGVWHQKSGNQSQVVSCSSNKYSYDELRSAVRVTSVQVSQTPETRQKADFNNLNTRNNDIPLENCLTLSDRALIESGAGEGERNRQGAKLARNLIGTAAYLGRSETEARNLFDYYCNRCNPSLGSREMEQIWKSAQKDNPSPTLTPDAIENCVAAWNRRAEPTSDEVKKPKKTRATKVTSVKLSYEQVLQRIDEMLEEFEDDPVRFEWELAMLAKEVGVSKSEMRLLYHGYRNSNPKKFRVRTIHEFLAEGSTEREWLIGGYIPKGTTICCFADGGVGKTLFAYDLAKAIAGGTHWNGFPTKQGKVLIVQTDEPEIDTRERLEIADYAKLPEASVKLITDWQFQQMRLLKKQIEADKPDFIIIDSLTSSNRGDAESEKDAAYAVVLYDLRDIANQYGCTIMVLHHENKEGGARGTTAIRNNVSEVWRLRKGEKSEALTPTQRILEFDKSRSGLYGSIRVELNPENYSWQHQGEFGDYTLDKGKQPLSAQILQFLEAHRGARFEPEELTHDFGGTTKDAIRKHLERLRKKGLLLSEDRVKPTSTGAVRYKVYFSPLLSNVAETQAQHDISTMDAPESAMDNQQELPVRKNDVQGVDPNSSNGSSDDGQKKSGSPSFSSIAIATPAIDQRVSVNVPDSNFYGETGIVKRIYEEGGEVYIEVRLESNGYLLDYKPEFLLW